MKTFRTNLLRWVMPFVIVASIGGSMLAVAVPQTVMAAPADECNDGFLGFPSWYRGLTDAKCDIKSPKNSDKLSAFIWKIALNVVEMAVVAGAYLSGLLFLFGGWMFIISRGNPEGAAKARSIITMSALGLVLMISAVALVEFINGQILP